MVLQKNYFWRTILPESVFKTITLVINVVSQMIERKCLRRSQKKLSVYSFLVLSAVVAAILSSSEIHSRKFRV